MFQFGTFFIFPYIPNHEPDGKTDTSGGDTFWAVSPLVFLAIS